MKILNEIINNGIPILKFMYVTIKHKYFVFKVGRGLKVPIKLLLVHDLSKFRWRELPHYARNFYGDKGDKFGFEIAWLRHTGDNKHHWEHWIKNEVSKLGNKGKQRIIKTPLEMPEEYVREMVSDWIAATRAYSGYYPKDLKDWKWFQESFHKVELHKLTKRIVIKVIAEYFKYESVLQIFKQIESVKNG